MGYGAFDRKFRGVVGEALMDYLQTLVEALARAARAVWPGAAGAAVAGYLGWSRMGAAGFLVAAAVGALAGTWIGHRAGLMPVKRVTTSQNADILVYSAGAFLVVAACYFLLQFAIIIGAIVANAALGLFWLSS